MLRRALALTVLLASTLLAVGSSPGTAAPPGFVGRSGTDLELDGQPYRFSGINIYNANNLSGCWYAMGSGSTLDDSLSAISSTGGPKVIRSWFFQALATAGGARDWSAIDNTLAVAAAHGTRVIATLGNQWSDCDGPGGGAGSYKDHAWYTGGYTEPDPGGTGSYRDWVAEIVDRYKNDPTILAWQLLNEAEVKPSEGSSCSPDAAVTLKDFADDVSGLIKSIDANHLVSLGTIGGGQCGAQGAEYQDVHDLATIDLCEYHDYGSPTTPMPGDQWNGLQVRVDQCNALDKPLFIGETGIRQEDLPTLQSRANAFRAKFGAQFLAGVDGELVWAWNKDGSAGSYDIGPGDPVLSLLDEFKDGPPESTMTSLTAPAANTFRITGFGLDDVRWIAINGGTRTGYDPYISYSLSVDRDVANYGHQPGDITVNEWSENVISITLRSGWYQDEYTRYITLVYSSGPNFQPETPLYVPGSNEMFPPEPTTNEGPVVTALTAPTANTLVVKGRNLDMLPYNGFSYAGDIIFEGNGFGGIGVTKPHAVPPPFTQIYTINEYSNTRISVTLHGQFVGTRYFNKVRWFDRSLNFAEFILPGLGIYLPADGEPIDTTPPTASITTPANGAQYFQGHSVLLAFSCGDDYELRSCQGQIVETGQFVGPHVMPYVPTSQLGSFTLRVTATDKFLNTTVSSASYTVVSNPDADGDGVPDSIDSDGGAGTGSPGFTDDTGDGKTTTGALVSGSMTVTDVSDPKGIRIAAGPSGVVLTVCLQGFGLELDPGDSVTVTCGSVTVENVVGTVVVRVPGNNALVTFPQGTSGTIDTTGGVSITNVIGTGVTVTIGGVQAPVTPGDSNLIQRGTAADRITGTAGNDLILDAGGDNNIDGKGGNDTIVVAGSGSNNIAGGAGDDSITSGSGNDTIDGGDGNDTINAGNGNNNLKGGAGNDSITSGSGNDTIDGGDGNDTINAGHGNNNLKGGAGNDRLSAGTGNDIVDGGAGTDLCNPGSGKNTVKNCEGTL